MTSACNPLPDPALSRWDYEGGAGPNGPQEGSSSSTGRPATPGDPSNEFDRLKARVIGLESVVIALLVDADEHQLGRVRDMAAQITPKQGAMPHRLTTAAAGHVASIVERALQIRSKRS